MQVTIDLEETIWTAQLAARNDAALAANTVRNAAAAANHAARMKQTPIKDQTAFTPVPEPTPLTLAQFVAAALAPITAQFETAQKKPHLDALAGQSVAVLERMVKVTEAPQTVQDALAAQVDAIPTAQ